MVKANIITKDGSRITVEGTIDEVSKLIELYSAHKSDNKATEFKKFEKSKKDTTATVTDVVREMIAEGFFNKPRGLAEIKSGMEERACFVPITTLSAIVLGLTKKKELRRIKKEKRWLYVRR
ncbi:MAG: hypothetical protein J7J92_02525 [Candidatus Aenigmarchaeota archaeon]|nr:hypothetical protein [Candidatus Aenigmarchaeota archaeon]